MTQAIVKKYPNKIVNLTEKERRLLEEKCRNRLSWTDGGYWMGSGPSPKCRTEEIISNSISHTILFTTDADALKWNLGWEKFIRYSGHGGTAALTTAVGIAFGGVPGIVVGTVAAIAKDELQARIPYPRVARGWSYELIFEHTYMWTPHPWNENGLTQVVTSIIRDHHKVIQLKTTKTMFYSLDELPDGLSRELASTLSRKTTSIFH